MNEKDLADFVTLQKTKADSKNSWSIEIKNLDQKLFDLSPKNPNKGEEVGSREPKEILKEIAVLDKESLSILNEITKQI